MSKKIIGMGHAIVDVICQVDDNFLAENKLVKASMTLIDHEQFLKFFKLPVSKISSGGSVANTISTLGMLGFDSYFIGSVGDDHFGKKFIEQLSQANCKFIGDTVSAQYSGISFILITPDGERTMCTYIGCAPMISEKVLNNQIFEDCNYLYIEGYLWDGSETSNSIKKAIEIAKTRNTKIALSLSDKFCVSRHRNDFIELISNDISLLFANENEFNDLTNQKFYSSTETDIFFRKILKQDKEFTAVITRSEKGCSVFKTGYNGEDNILIDIAGNNVQKVVDTTGAGDNFASGWFFGYYQNQNLSSIDQKIIKNNLGHSGKFANLLASNIIQKYGARFDAEELNKIINN